jgi:GntR family transcriptional regulator
MIASNDLDRLRNAAAELTPDLVDEHDVTPLYHQVYLALRERIRRSVFPPGAPLPGELELVKLFGVSRITVKRALNELAAGGFVARHRGRGTIVTFNAAAPVVQGNFENLLDSLKLMGLGTDVRLLEHAIVKAPDEVQKQMNLPKGAKVQRAVRLRSIEGEPFSYLITHVPADIAATYSVEELAAMPLLQLLERAGHAPSAAEQWITACAADPGIAKALGIASGSPLLEIRRVMTDRDGHVVEALQGYYRPERFQHHMKLARRRRGGKDEWR